MIDLRYFCILTKIFSKTSSSKSKKIGGLECFNRLECAQLILEHEIIHLIIQESGEYLKEGLNSKIYGDHGLLFKNLLRSYFGHTDIHHEMLKRSITKESRNDFEIKEEISEKSTKSNIKIGDTVRFYSGMRNGVLTGKIQTGTVIKINPKRVKVQIGNSTATVPYILLV